MENVSASFVIPVFNEEENVVSLYNEIKKEVASIKKIISFEVVFINDGSTDKTQVVLEALKKQEKTKVRVIEFRKNFGKAAAYNAGFALAKGDLIFTMDGDGQDNPKNIAKFLNEIEKGSEVVVGWKFNRKDPFGKRIPSKFFNLFLRSFSKLALHDMDSGYRCIKKEALSDLDLYAGMYRYIPLMLFSKGYRVTEVKVDHRERKAGKSKYGFSRIFGGFFDLITIQFLYLFLKKPLHFFGGVGSIFFGAGFIIAAYQTYIKLALDRLIGEPMLILSALLMIIGVQFFLFGLLGEMIVNTSRKEKNYTVRKTL